MKHSLTSLTKARQGPLCVGSRPDIAPGLLANPDTSPHLTSLPEGGTTQKVLPMRTTGKMLEGVFGSVAGGSIKNHIGVRNCVNGGDNGSSSSSTGSCSRSSSGLGVRASGSCSGSWTPTAGALVARLTGIRVIFALRTQR
uniref:Uncharacterized protein n=1 Tax=Rousettus aegyptiacus TaxID=9407 RepID=A0A7J8G9U7_ROUAE|nr:hypothetical protein HJG63_011527 [Rousettus aegyptiacus]